MKTKRYHIIMDDDREVEADMMEIYTTEQVKAMFEGLGYKVKSCTHKGESVQEEMEN